MPPTENTISKEAEECATALSAILEGGCAAEPPDTLAGRQAALLAFGRRTNARPQLPILMQDAGALVAEVLQAELNGVGKVAADGSLLLKVVSTDTRGKVLDTVSHEVSLAAEDSMAGWALSNARPVTTSDMAAEERFADALLQKLEVRSALTIPLHLNREPLGTLGAYSRKRREFSPDDVRFAETIAHLLTSSIGRMKAEEELHRQHAFTTTVLDLVDALVLVLNQEGELVDTNRAVYRTTGFTNQEIRGRPFCNVFSIDDEIELFRQAFRSAVESSSPCEFQNHLLTKDGMRRLITWSAKSMRDEQGNVRSVVLTGIDRTEHFRVSEELQQAEAVVRRTNQALQELREQVGRVGFAGSAPPEISDAAAAEGAVGKVLERAFRPLRPVEKMVQRELRASARRHYQYRQPIAPIFDNRMPSRDKFFEVTCRDISASGISFYLDNAPDFDGLVVALGTEPAISYFTAKVVRVEKRQLDGKKTYVVGCRFTGRANL